MTQWLSWLERRPVTAEVTGSSPVWVVKCRKKGSTKLEYFLRHGDAAEGGVGHGTIDEVDSGWCDTP